MHQTCCEIRGEHVTNSSIATIHLELIIAPVSWQVLLWAPDHVPASFAGSCMLYLTCIIGIMARQDTEGQLCHAHRLPSQPRGVMHCPTENKAINMGLHILYRFTQYWHSKKVRISMNAPMFSIITQEVFIVRHWFKHSHIPKKIRNQTISRRVGNGLNSLSYDETKKSQHGLRKVRHRCVYRLCCTMVKALFPCAHSIGMNLSHTFQVSLVSQSQTHVFKKSAFCFWLS